MYCRINLGRDLKSQSAIRAIVTNIECSKSRDKKLSGSNKPFWGKELRGL